MPTDLEIARAKAPVDSKALSQVVCRPGQLELRDRILAILKKDPIFDNSDKAHLDHPGRIRRILRITHRLVQLRVEHNWSYEEWREALRLQDDNIPCMLHENAFIPVIESQGSEEQQKEWLPRSLAYEVLGCYCQTELGHGSNVAGLETTATFDPVKDEFLVNSPRLESSKWWVGALGVMANHTVCQAILYLPDPANPGKLKSYGPHLFIVPLRSMTDHKLLPGVLAGDIGPKAYGGFGSVDNGYLQLDHVRIPRKNMLQRFAKVDAKGVYTPPKHDKLSYGSMVYLRAGIPEVQGWNLARATTTAIRYSTVRRQFKAGPKEDQEAQVITYAGVKYRLVPLLAKAYTLIFAGRQFWGMYEEMLDGLVKRGDVSMLAEVHTLSTALKATSTWDAVTGIEEARKSMGGHGFSALAGVGHIFANATPAQTYEGDNYVISQQIARSLLKSLAFISKSPKAASALPKSAQYLTTLLQPTSFAQAKSSASSPVSWLCPRTQLAALTHRAANSVLNLAQRMRKDPTQPISAHSFETAGVARAHAELYFARAFYEVLEGPKVQKNSAEYKALLTLAQISGLDMLLGKAQPELLVSGYLSASQARDMKTAYEGLVDGVSTELLVGLTDAFGLDDWELGVLGRKDGKVYEGMWAEVRKWDGQMEPLREEVVKIVEYGRGNVGRVRGKL